MKDHLYFIGIAGHAMRGLALATREMGFEVTGLDESAQPPGSTWVDEHDFRWWRTFEPVQLDTVATVIVTGAFATDDYPAIVEANKRQIQIKSSAQLWGELTLGKHVIAVAGTHGKTSTASLITWLLQTAGRHPDFLIGIRPFNFESSVRLRGSEMAVVEGDEYMASKLEAKSKVQYYHPDTLVLTSIEHDHPDMYPDLNSVMARFKEIVSQVPASGHLVAWAESDSVLDVAKSAVCNITTYGLEEGDCVSRNVVYQPTGIEFEVEKGGNVLGRVAVPLFGKHNVLNVLAATTVALSEGMTIRQIIDGAATFRGAYRRFNVISPSGSPITVIDDYAHHPTEAAVNIDAARLHFPGRRVVVIYRPHTYSRTAALLPEYKTAFDRADLVYITSIEGAREAGLEHTVSGNDIVQALKLPALYAPDRTELVQRVKLDSKPGDVILCLTVSGYDGLAQELATILKPTADKTDSERE